METSDVKSLREKNGLTRKQLAQKAGVTSETVRKIETDTKHRVQQRTMAKLEKALVPKKLAGFTGNPVTPKKTNKAAKSVNLGLVESEKLDRLWENAKAAKKALDEFLNTEIFIFEAGDIPTELVKSSLAATKDLTILIADLEKVG